MPTAYTVTARHPAYGVADHHFDVRSQQINAAGDIGFYAMSADLGCGKTYATPLAAVSAMCADHALTVLSYRATEAV